MGRWRSESGGDRERKVGARAEADETKVKVGQANYGDLRVKKERAREGEKKNEKKGPKILENQSQGDQRRVQVQNPAVSVPAN